MEGFAETGRHDADYGPQLIVDFDFAANNFRIRTIAPLPKSVSDQKNIVFPRLIFFCGEDATEERPDAQCGKVFGGNEGALNAFRLTAVDDIGGPPAHGGNIGERLGIVLEIQEICIADAGGGRAFVMLLDADKMPCIGVRQGTQQDGVDDGEEGGVGADAEGESEDGDHGETGAAAQHAGGVAKIPCGRVQPADDVHRAGVFFHQRCVSEATLRIVTRFVRLHPSDNIVPCSHLDVGAKFFIHSAIQFVFVKQAAQTREQ